VFVCSCFVRYVCNCFNSVLRYLFVIPLFLVSLLFSIFLCSILSICSEFRLNFPLISCFVVSFETKETNIWNRIKTSKPQFN
jgi:hypothetical protein